jgi:hypothetical protein
MARSPRARIPPALLSYAWSSYDGSLGLSSVGAGSLLSAYSFVSTLPAFFASSQACCKAPACHLTCSAPRPGLPGKARLGALWAHYRAPRSVHRL